MPEFAERLMRFRVVRLLFEATMRFADDDVPRMAAAMSYFMLLATAPLVLFANVIFVVIGALTGHVVSTGSGAATQAAQASYQQATAWAGGYSPWVVGALVLIGAVSVFVQFVQSVNLIWGTHEGGNAVRSYVRRRGVALALLGVAALAFVIALAAAAIVAIVAAIGLAYAESLGIAIPDIARNALARAALVYVAAALLFAVAFVLAPDRRIRWRDALPSALVTAGLFVVGTYLLTLYLSTTQRFAVFGPAQFFMALTVWIYYSAIVILWGVELSRIMILEVEAAKDLATE